MEYTILEAAQLLGCTKGGIRYRLDDLPPDAVAKTDSGRLQITAAGIEILADLMGRPANWERVEPHRRPHSDRVEPDREPDSDCTEPDRERTEARSDCVEPHSNRAEADRSQIDGAAVADLLRETLDELRGQLAEKDIQLQREQEANADLRQQLSTVTAALQAAQEQAKAAQALHAGTLQAQLMESTATPAAQPAAGDLAPEVPRKRWWKLWKI